MKSVFKKSLQMLMFVPAMALGVSLVAPVLQPVNVGAAIPGGGTSGSCDDIVGSGDVRKGAECAKGTGQSENLFGSGGLVTVFTNVLLFLVGAISVIMLIVGGIRYVLSAGNSGAVASAKNTIVYAVIGVVVALLGYAIINFVIGTFSTPA